MSLIPLPEASSPNAITLGIRVSTYEFVGDTNIQSLTLPLPYGTICLP